MISARITKDGFEGNLIGTASYALNANTVETVEWGKISGSLDDQEDLIQALNDCIAVPSQLPTLYVDGGPDLATLITRTDVAAKEISLPVECLYINGISKQKIYGKIKLQGTSSLAYPKKNFTLTLYTDSTRVDKLKLEMKPGWGQHSKYCIKANYIDHSHARNICAARLWSQIVGSEPNRPQELLDSPNNGAIDGFPIKMYVNNSYYGICTFNIPKGDWMFNMDEDNLSHGILCGENYVGGCFRALPVIDGSDWSEELRDTPTSDELNSWSSLVDIVLNGTNEFFVDNIESRLDLISVIDYYIFCYVITSLDSLGKNQIYITYNGVKWYASMYDMDSTFGLYWNGRNFVSTSYRCQEDYESMVNSPGNLLFSRVVELFPNRVQERYEELRAGILSYSNILSVFEEFISQIPDKRYEDDLVPYPNIPSAASNNIWQIRNYVRDRLSYVDSQMISVHVQSISVDSPEQLISGRSYDLEALITPGNANRYDLRWSITNITGSPETDPTINSLTGVIQVPEECTVTVMVEDLISGFYGTATISFMEGELYENLPLSGIVSGSPFTLNASRPVDLSSEAVAVAFNMTSTTTTNQNIISIGENIGDWNASTHSALLHIYCPSNTEKVQFDLNWKPGTSHRNIRLQVPYNTSSPNILVLNPDSIYFNGQLVVKETEGIGAGVTSSGQPASLENLSEFFSQLRENTNNLIGSTEGVVRSQATYDLVRIYSHSLTNIDIQDLWFDIDNPNSVVVYNNSNLEFDGTGGVNTGIKIDSYENSTVKMIFTPGTQDPSENMATIFHCIQEVSPWPGVAVMASSGKYQLSLWNDRRSSYITQNDPGTHTLSIIRRGNNFEAKLGDVNMSGVPAGLSPIPDEELHLGQYVDNAGNTGRYWTGTINKIKITQDIL